LEWHCNLISFNEGWMHIFLSIKVFDQLNMRSIDSSFALDVINFLLELSSEFVRAPEITNKNFILHS
jgi:hypothetical protein